MHDGLGGLHFRDSEPEERAGSDPGQEEKKTRDQWEGEGEEREQYLNSKTLDSLAGRLSRETEHGTEEEEGGVNERMIAAMALSSLIQSDSEIRPTACLREASVPCTFRMELARSEILDCHVHVTEEKFLACQTRSAGQGQIFYCINQAK